ncbi:MAG: PD-(D/E)XK nuclease family protein, partial [Thermoanaerobaculia bacterium]|nr:PD-(D/E)XK nuclease family protein [Thermoanaerobaculia bacterium]
YRSDPPLLDAINAIFACVFADSSSDANVFRPEYRALQAGRRELRRDSDARITFLHSEAGVEGYRYLREAEAVAEWILAHRDGGSRDLQRFAILFRRLTKLDEYLDTFDRYGIDYVLPTTRAFLDRRAPVDILAVLRAIAFPFDRGAEVSAARTPYFALTDDEIGEGILGSGEAWTQFQAALGAYRDAAAHLTVSGTIDLLVASTEIERVYDALSDGTRARRHLEHLRTLAFAYDQKLGGSIRQFVAEIDRRREEPDEMEPSLADDGSNAIRILLVHAAKGLEFETVILPDLAFQAATNEGQTIFAVEEPKSLVMSGRAQSISGHFRFAGVQTRVKSISRERDKTEMRRLFYVAVTRAISEVVFVSTADVWKNDGFFSCVAEVFGFKKDSFASMWPAEPGRLVTPKPVGPAIVPVAFERMRIRDVAGQSHAQLVDRDLEAALRQGDLVPVSIDIPAALPTALTAADSARARAGAKKRAGGTLLHRFLEQWSGNGDADALLSRLAAESGADEVALRNVKQRIASLRRSPAFNRIAAAETIGREMPLRIIDEIGSPVEKRIDRLIREAGREIVVDYKTGRPDPARLEGDREQVARYCKAIEAITTRPCSGLLWYIDDERDELVPVSAAASP